MAKVKQICQLTLVIFNLVAKKKLLIEGKMYLSDIRLMQNKTQKLTWFLVVIYSSDFAYHLFFSKEAFWMWYWPKFIAVQKTLNLQNDYFILNSSSV